MQIKYFVTAIILSAFWLLLTEGEITSLIVGVFFVALAIFASYRLAQGTEKTAVSPQIKIGQVPKFVLFFLVNSVKGGLATAKIAFSPIQSITPNFVHYPIMSLKKGPSTHLFMNLISLLPGSVSVVREPSGVLVHVLNTGADTISELQKCEVAVCNLFGISRSTDTTI
jgi:multicomponent Na+:H+ antiporter subunit E